MGIKSPKVRAGDPLRFSAFQQNTSIDVNRAWQEGRLGGSPAVLSKLVAGELLIKNSSGSDVNRYEILGISGILFSHSDNSAEFLNRPVLTGVTPDDFDHYGQFVVCLEPIKHGKIGRAQVGGLVPVQIDKTISSDVGWADVKDADRTQLRTHPGGTARIVDIETGTGKKWAIVDLHAGPPSSWIVGHATNTIGAATGTGIGRTLGSGTMNLYEASSSNVITSLGRTWTVYNLTDTASAANIPMKADVDTKGRLILDVEEC